MDTFDSIQQENPAVAVLKSGQNQRGNPSGWRFLWPGGLALLAAAPIALLIQAVNQALAGQPERVVLMLLIILTVLLAMPVSVYVLAAPRAANPGRFGLIALATAGVLLVAIYLFWVSYYVRFPADTLIWSEGDFVNDILKFRVGYPLFTAQVNNDSFTYVPGPQLLTYFLAWLLGSPTSIPVYRLIQIGYTLSAVLLAVFSGRELLKASHYESRFTDWRLWSAVWLPFLFLAATNSLTNPFTHNLHDDALAQLVSALAYFLVVRYDITRDRRTLALMALLPGVSFLIKQSLITWAGLYWLYLLFCDRPFNLRRLVIFAVVSFGFIGVVAAGCYLLWGEPFVFWIFTVLGSHGVSPLRSFQHVLDVWIYYVMGILGGFVLVRGKNAAHLLGLWLIWLFVMALETYTSGIAWMTNHIGPGSLIATIWFLAALPRLWSVLMHPVRVQTGWQDWVRSGMFVGITFLLFSGMGVFRIPLPPLPQDAYRYIHEIEAQFEGQPADKVLLDAGSWVYIKDQVIMKDRAPSIGERGYSETGDFSGIIQRFQDHAYSKILVRNLDSPEFWYENYLWPKPAGIKQALLANYHVVGEIRGVEGVDNYLFDTISILVPNSK